jgi:NADH dehydrogenase [ubiquinone] 1 alpha subcomplex assembly factor 7
VLGLASPRFRALPEGATIEVSPTAYRIARRVGEVVAGLGREEKGGEKALEGKGAVGGCGLIVDYGGDKVFGDSFRVRWCLLVS